MDGTDESTEPARISFKDKETSSQFELVYGMCFREHSPLREVSLYEWSPVFQV